MRTIKFRGKKEYSEEWVYGNLIQFDWADFIVKYGSFEERDRVIPETVGQFTGYTMNNVDVYFDDLVSNNYPSDKQAIRKIVLFQGTICMQLVAGKSKLPEYIGIYEFHNFNYKVIGNIYDNPELMK